MSGRTGSFLSPRHNSESTSLSSAQGAPTDSPRKVSGADLLFRIGHLPPFGREDVFRTFSWNIAKFPNPAPPRQNGQVSLSRTTQTPEKVRKVCKDVHPSPASCRGGRQCPLEQDIGRGRSISGSKTAYGLSSGTWKKNGKVKSSYYDGI